MASITKTAKGYRAQIKKRGVRDSRVFPTRREAVQWSLVREDEIERQAATPLSELHTLAEAITHYEEHSAPKLRGSRWEIIRLHAFEKNGLPVGRPIGSITPEVLSAFRDARLKHVRPSTARRELTTLSSVFDVAKTELHWISTNPVREIGKPKLPSHRERLINVKEIRLMLRAMGYRKNAHAVSAGQAVAVCWLVAMRTGMRAGELCGLTWDRVFDDYCHLPMTKNGTPRDVPLSRRAKVLVEQMRGWDEILVFGLKSASLDALFRKYRERCGLSGFTFHDSRHTAATMLARKMGVLDLCRMFGWKDTKQALTYFNSDASSIARLIDNASTPRR